MLSNLLKEAGFIFDYPEEVSVEYIKHSKSMLEYVNNLMIEDSNISDLIGNNPISLINNNHENHIQFMKNVIKYKQKELFVYTLPWVYRAYYSRGVKFAYFELELNSWINAIEKFVEEEYRLPLINIYKQMLNWHESLIELSKNGGMEEFKHNVCWTDSHEDILKYLLSGNHRGLIKTSESILKGDLSIIDYYLQYLQPVMYKIGELWEKGIISVAHEHLATSTLARVMTNIYPDYILGELNRGIAVISAGVNEFHQMGARMVADALEFRGWDVRYLGANVPNNELIKLVKEIKPDFVGLSMTMAYYLDDMIETISELKENFSSGNFKVMVGGLAINNRLELQHIIGADAYPVNAEESVEIAEKWYRNGK